MVAVLVAPAPALAGDDTSPPAAVAKAKDPKRKICQPVEETGSRLSSKRICLTAEQWEAQSGGKSGAKRPEKSSGNGGGR